MKNSDLISQLVKMTNMNKTQTILSLFGAGYDFQKELNEQDIEIDEKVSQMLLQTLVTPVISEVEEVSEIIQVKEETTQEPHQDEPREDQRETQLMELFNESKTIPSKRKDKKQLTELILNILIPKSSKGQLKGRIQKDVHKRKYVTQLINNNYDKEQLSRDLILWIDDFALRANKRK